MTKEEKKSEIIKICKSEIQKRITIHTQAMKDAQETANKYKGAMESRYDTFKEEAQQRRDSHAKQIDSLMRQLSILINSDMKPKKSIQFGSVAETEIAVYFICFFISDDELYFNNKELITLREDTPLGISLKGKGIGETINFNNKEIIITNIY